MGMESKYCELVFWTSQRNFPAGMSFHHLQRLQTSVHFTEVTTQLLEYPRKPGYNTYIFKSRCTGGFAIKHIRLR